MILSQWFYRLGIDQVIAPDPVVLGDGDGDCDGDEERRQDDAGDGVVALDGSGGGVVPQVTTKARRFFSVDEEESPLWDILAPRASAPVAGPFSVLSPLNGPNAIPPSNAFAAARAIEVARFDSPDSSVRCLHCHKMTPVRPAAGSAPSLAGRGAGSISSDSVSKEIIDHEWDDDGGEGGERDRVERMVIEACRSTAVTLSSPTFVWEHTHKVFNICGGTVPSGKVEKQIRRLAKLLKKDPALLRSRSCNMKALVPDGFNVLHTACYAGNEGMVNFLLKFVEVGNKNDEGGKNDGRSLKEGEDDPLRGVTIDIDERDMQGRTALHVAADRGHVKIVEILKEAYGRCSIGFANAGTGDARANPCASNGGNGAAAESAATTPAKTTRELTPPPMGSNAPIDLAGRTPLAYAATSNHSQAKKNRVVLERMLYEPGDPSIMGVFTPPPRQRCGTVIASSVNGASDSDEEIAAPIFDSVYVSGESRNTKSWFSPPRPAAMPRSGRKLAFQGMTPTRANGGRRRYRRTPAAGRGSALETPGSVVAASAATFPTPSTPPMTGCRRLEDGTAEKSGIKVAGGGVGVILEEGEPLRTGGDAATAVPEAANATVLNPDTATHLKFGFADRPGFRIEMEDAICVNAVLTAPPLIQLDTRAGIAAAVAGTGMFGVFDGHGDGGFASRYVSLNLQRRLNSDPEWGSVVVAHARQEANCGDLLVDVLVRTCEALDEDLRDDPGRTRDGGTTAVVAVVLGGTIAVANVGDSRCVLVRKKRKDAAVAEQGEGRRGGGVDGDAPTMVEENEADVAAEEASEVVEEAVTAADGEGSSEAVAAKTDDSAAGITPAPKIETIALSKDHKAHLPSERTRIEAAGLEVIIDCVQEEDGTTTVIHRVKKSEKDMIGVSRAFGDYDYKSNEIMPPSRQAVVCTPEIEMHKRDDDHDMFLILACDGVWDVATNEETGEFVTRRFAERLSSVAAVETEGGGYHGREKEEEILAKIGDDLMNMCLERGSKDNMSVLIVALPASKLSLFSVPVLAGDGAARTLAF